MKIKYPFKIIEQGLGDNYIAKLNKYVRSGTVGTQPIVQQDANGKFFVTFTLEVLLSKNYSDLSLQDTVYAGMEVDSSSIKVFFRPKDSVTYYLPNPNPYKDNYEIWQSQNPSGHFQ